MKLGDKLHYEQIGDCIVVAIHPLGTIDVKSCATGRYYRISGLRV